VFKLTANLSCGEGTAVWACGAKATSDIAGLGMRDRSIVAQMIDPPAAQRDRPIAQICQMRTTHILPSYIWVWL